MASNSKKILSVSELFSDQSFLEKLEEFNSYTNKSVLNKADILESYKNGLVIIATEGNLKALNEQQLQNCSYDVTLGKYYFRSQNSDKNVLSVGSVKTYYEYWGSAHEANTVQSNEYKTAIKYGLKPGDKYIILKPGELILGHTNEFIGGINCINSELRTRSTMRRCGIDICASAGWGDIGYVNRWTLEIKNDTTRNVILPVNVRIGQIIFLTTTMIDSDDSYAGNYQMKGSLEEVIKKWNYTDLLPKDKRFPLPEFVCGKDELTLDYVLNFKNEDFETKLSNKLKLEMNEMINSNTNNYESKINNIMTSMQPIISTQTLTQERIDEFTRSINEIRDMIREIREIKSKGVDLDVKVEPVVEKLVEPVVVETKVVEPVVEKLIVEPVVEKVSENKVSEPVVEPVVETKVVEPVVETKVTEPVVEKVSENNVIEKVVEPVVEIKSAEQEEPVKINPLEKFFDENNSLSYSNDILNTVASDMKSDVRSQFVKLESKTEMEEEIENVKIEDSDEEKYDLFMGNNNNSEESESEEESESDPKVLVQQTETKEVKNQEEAKTETKVQEEAKTETKVQEEAKTEETK
jgi:dCTP deaminase